jgi:hypothetical protein
MKENEIIKRLAIRERLLPNGLRRLAGEDADPKRDRRYPLAAGKPLPRNITRLHFTDGSPRPATTEKRRPYFHGAKKRWCVKLGKKNKPHYFKTEPEAEAALEQARKKEWINIIIDQDLNADPPSHRPRRHRPGSIAVADATRQAVMDDEEKEAAALEVEREEHDEVEMNKIEDIEAPDADWKELSRSLGGIPRR